jgi:hypothetical protein
MTESKRERMASLKEAQKGWAEGINHLVAMRRSNKLSPEDAVVLEKAMCSPAFMFAMGIEHASE